MTQERHRSFSQIEPFARRSFPAVLKNLDAGRNSEMGIFVVGHCRLRRSTSSGGDVPSTRQTGPASALSANMVEGGAFGWKCSMDVSLRCTAPSTVTLLCTDSVGDP